MKGLFLKIKGFKILLHQEDQLLIGLIKILQASNGQDHLIVDQGDQLLIELIKILQAFNDQYHLVQIRVVL